MEYMKNMKTININRYICSLYPFMGYKFRLGEKILI